MTTHIWQATVFALVAAALAFALRNHRAAVRYWIWLAASLKFLVPFALLVNAGRQVPAPPAPAIVTSPAAALETVFLALPAPVAEPHSDAVLIVVWALGFLAVIAAWIRRYRRVQASPILEPAVFGILRPKLILPEGIERHLTPEQLRAVIAHETCHIRRRDNLFAAVHMLVEALFWFHPLVWWIGARLIDERERACDEEVLRQGADPESYATGILEVCKLCLESPVPCVAGVTGADLQRRVVSIMAAPIARRLTLAHKAVLTFAAAGAVLAPITAGLLHAQADTFEVASIRAAKPTDGPLRVSLNATPGGINFSNVTLKACIRRAWGLKTYQIVGGPSWIGTDRFQISAKTARPTSEIRLMPMLRKLLVERFQLESHQETREMPIYSLTIAKGGSKLPPAKSDDTEVDGDAGELRMQGVSSSMIATVLSQSLDRPVVDRTGLTGKYNVTLKFARETADGAPSDAPSIFTAVQEQLGLKLEAVKGPVEVLIIDSARKPSEN